MLVGAWNALSKLMRLYEFLLGQIKWNLMKNWFKKAQNEQHLLKKNI